MSNSHINYIGTKKDGKRMKNPSPVFWTIFGQKQLYLIKFI